MFGRNDENTGQENTNDTGSESTPSLSVSEQPTENQPLVAPQATVVHPDVSLPGAITAVPTNSEAWQHPGAPLGSATPQVSGDGAAAPVAVTAPPAPAPVPVSMTLPSDDQSVQPDSAGGENLTHELIDIKQQALGQLSPLLSTLDQPPEDKFRTLMMMIQASDDQSLVKSAYEAAHNIEDEKARAQALLDIVNEINYFTTQHQQ